MKTHYHKGEDLLVNGRDVHMGPNNIEFPLNDATPYIYVTTGI
jgi:hypothetical protein